eukprot:181175_1
MHPSCHISMVSVRCSGLDPQKAKVQKHKFKLTNDGSSTLSCSGILLTKHPRPLVVCHGGAVAPFLQARGVNSGDTRFPEMRDDVQLEILFECDVASDCIGCRLIFLDEISEVNAAVRKLTRGSLSWTVGWYNESHLSKFGNGQRFSAGSVALLEIVGKLPNNLINRNMRIGCSRNVQRGDPIICIASPYGLLSPDVLHNSVSRGCISNIVYGNHSKTRSICGPDMFLVDARCLPGSEGGAVFDQYGELIGMISLPLRHSDGYPVEFTTVISIEAVIRWTRKIEAQSQLSTQMSIRSISDKSQPILENSSKSLALVEVNTMWCSGIVISSDGYIVTNEHVLRSAYTKLTEEVSHRLPSNVSKNRSVLPTPPSLHPNTDIRVRVHSESGDTLRVTASVVYVSSGRWDLCLLKAHLPPSGSLIPAVLRDDIPT